MKKTLVIMGTHWKGFRDFDWSRKDCDIWAFNEAPNAENEGKKLFPKVDAVFQLHHEAIWKNPKNRNDQEHYDWLTSGKTPAIYMQEKFPEVPKAIKYPLKEIISLTDNVKVVVDGKRKDFKFFTSSPEFALALAAEMTKQGKGYKRVEVWGIELETESEYTYQRVGFAFWVGYLAALNVELVLYNSIFDAAMYGYEGDIAISAEFLEKRISDLTQELGTDKQLYAEEAKRFLDSILNLVNADTSKQIEINLNELMKKYERAGILNGQIKECTSYLEKAQAMEQASGGSSVFSMGEFDSMRYMRNIEYTRVRGETATLNSQISFYLNELLRLKKGSQKRQKAVEKVGGLVAEMLNKNMVLLHIIGSIKENQFFIDSSKLSIKAALAKK